MSKRIRTKRIKGLLIDIADGVRLFASRPQGGRTERQDEELVLGLLQLQVGIALSLLHQWYPPARRGAGISETGVPKVDSVDSTHWRVSGLVTYSQSADDAEDVTGEYIVEVERVGSRWLASRLRVVAPAGYVSPAAL